MSKKKLIVLMCILAVVGIALFAIYFVSSRLKIDGTGYENTDSYVYDENGVIETDPDTGEPYVYETDSNVGPTAPISDEGEPTPWRVEPTPAYIEEPTEINDASTDIETNADGDVIGVVTLPN